MERVFEIGRIFRNEGISTRHNPEFTMMELYQAFADWTDMMAITEELITQAARDALGTTVVTIRGQEVDLAEPWPRLSMSGAVSDKVGERVHPSMAIEPLRAIADRHGATYEPSWGTGRIIESLFEELCEHDLVRPTFVTGHPVEISPLARVDRDDPFVTERFELFVDSRELANGYSELNDPVEQRLRFEAGAGRQGGRRRRARHGRRGLPAGARVRHAADGRARHRHRPRVDAAGRRRQHPRGRSCSRPCDRSNDRPGNRCREGAA